MQNFIAKILMNKAGEGDGGAGTGSSGYTETPPANDPNSSKSAGQQPPAKGAANLETQGAETDEFGYEKAPAAPGEKKEGEAPKEGQEPPKAPAAEPKKVEDPATGYGKEPVVDPSKKADDKTPPAPPSDLEKRLETLPQELQDEVKEDVARMSKMKLSPEAEKEQIDFLVERANKKFTNAKTNFENNEQTAKIRKQERNKGWFKELKEDPSFGGDKFDGNVHRAEQVLADRLPRTKKILTEAKEMLPPYLMRDLLENWERDNPADKMVTGEPPAPENKDDESNNPLDFYQ
jgi:hypothetical protein